MDANPISREEHEEFKKRLEEDSRRQDARLEIIESEVREIKTLSTSIERLASNMETMAKEQERQGQRLEAVESRDGEMWRKTAGYVITAILSIVIGFIFSKIGM